MKLALGWAAGVLTAWAMLAIWRRIPALPHIDACTGPEHHPDCPAEQFGDIAPCLCPTILTPSDRT